MESIVIKHNPYLSTTEVMINDKPLKLGSNLNFGSKRIQEWVDDLPRILCDELRNSNFKIHFIGIQNDYEDLKLAFENYNSNDSERKIHYELSSDIKRDISEVEKSVSEIFEEIQDGPIAELKDEKIINAFNKAKDSKFEVSVIATMSSGKSTLINALLGKELMPAANEATTATIVKIIDNDEDVFSATTYNKSGVIIEEISDVSLNQMRELNRNPNVSIIEIKGRIPFVSSVGMQLVLVDTPGPNNSKDISHQEVTYRAIANTENSMILFVMNGQQLGIADEKNLLDYICEKMSEGGKKSRERFIFAVNKMDSFSIKNDGIDGIERALEGAKEALENRGIHNPNIFPISAGAALEKRTEEEDEADALNSFRNKATKYKEFHLEKYYHFNNLPQRINSTIEDRCQKAEGDDKIEIHTGIVSLEEAIKLYINKYARITKVCDLVDSFNESLNQISVMEHFQKTIRESQEDKSKIDEQIFNIQSILESAETAKEQSEKINNIDIKKEIKEKTDRYIDKIRNKTYDVISSKEERIKKENATEFLKDLEQKTSVMSTQVKIEIEEIIKETYNNTLNKEIEEYKEYLKNLNISKNNYHFSLNPLNLVAQPLKNLSDIVDSNKIIELEFPKFDIFDYKTWYLFRKKEAVEYIELKTISEEYLENFRENLKEIQKKIEEYAELENRVLKERLDKSMKEIKEILHQNLKKLSETKLASQTKVEEIEQKERNLRWLENIENKVNNLIKF